MQEVRDIFNAIEFLGEVVKAQQTAQQPDPSTGDSQEAAN
jgi:hypothetical protein